MTINCIENFKIEYEKLIRKKSYQSLETDLIGYFFNTSIEKLQTGTRLNNSETTPYIKKRLKGRGGFRTYYLLIVKEKNLYLMFVHPKSGSLGSDNITDESKSFLYKKVLLSIKSSNLFELKLSSNGDSITFKPVSKKKND